MNKKFPNYFSRLEIPLLMLSLSILLICLIYVYLLVMQVGYEGFESVASQRGWLINHLESCEELPEWCANRNQLQVGDLILQIGELDYDTFLTSLATPFEGYSAGDQVALLVSRGDTEFEILWQLPEIRLTDRIVRLLSTVLFIPFWLAGTIVLLFLRPRNVGWGLLVAFNYLTALWLVFGFNSPWNIAFSSILLHVVTWLILPVYIHLHLAMPESLIGRRTRIFLIALYALALVMSVLELGLFLPRQLFFLPFILAVGVSIGLLVYRYRRQDNERVKPSTQLMLFGIVMGVGPALILAIGLVFTEIIPQNLTIHLTLLSFPILPFAYTYALYKRRLGRAELRANRLLGLYTYSVLILMVFFLLFVVGLPAIGNVSNDAVFVYVIVSVLIFVMISAGLWGHFQRWINQLAYGVKYDADQLIALFSRRLSGISQREKLVEVISGDILPNLLIRQSAMFFQQTGKADVIYATGVENSPNDFAAQHTTLLGNYTAAYLSEPVPGLNKFSWVRLVIPLEIRQDRTGFWLFGRRDPDDYYPQSDIQLLQSLGSLVAPVLENIQLFNLVQNKLEESAALLKSSQAVNSSLTWPAALSEVADVLLDTLHVAAVSINEWDSREEKWLILADTNYPRPDDEPNWEAAQPQDVISAAGWPVEMPPAGQHTRWRLDDVDIPGRWRAALAAHNVTQLITFPIYTKEQLVGSVFLWESRPERVLEQDETALIQAIVQQVALAFENAQLFRAEEQRRQEAELLAELSEYLASTLDLDEVLSRIVKSVRGYVREVHNSSISLLEPDSRSLRPYATWYKAPEYDPMVSQAPIPLGETHISRQVIETLQPVWIEDLLAGEQKPEKPAHLKRSPRALLYVPLIIRGEAIGVLHIHVYDQPYRFRPEEVSFCINVANQAATAIENAQLHDALQIYADNLAAEVDKRTAQLLTERDRIEAILHNAGEGIFFTSPEGVLLYANPAALTITGYRSEEVIGQHVVNWWGEPFAPETRQELSRAIEIGESWRGEITGARKSGVIYVLRLTLAPIFDADGEITGYVGVQSDITRLREVDRLRTEFIANVSHELRTPLTNIKTYLALLERGKPDSRQRHLQVIKMESERLRRLIEDLLDFSRRQPSQVQFAPVSLPDLVRQVVNAFAAKAKEKNISLRKEMLSGVPVVLGDAHQLGQVLSNLISNALAYTPAGGWVTVSTGLNTQNGPLEAYIQVSDSGLGIAKSDMPFIFERFYRGSAAQQGNTPGTGLGLAISQDIVESHGGHLHVESEENRGSTFTVWLPVSEEVAEVSQEVEVPVM